MIESRPVAAWVWGERWKVNRESGEKQEGGITKGHEETFRSDEYVCHLDFGDGFRGVYILT